MTPTLYDHPLYYDILFGWDRGAEARVYGRIFESNAVSRTAGILEVACGTGQIGRRLARAGWRVSGLDDSPDMLAFLAEQATRDGVLVATILGDMAGFECTARFGAAFNPMSSFRLLKSDAEADAHLACMAEVLLPGAVYVLDLELAASLDAPAVTTSDAWEMSRDGITVRATDAAIEVLEGGAKKTLRWATEGHLRPQTRSTFEARITASQDFEIARWHPESGDLEGISTFDAHGTVKAPDSGRTLVTLRRR